MENYFDIGIVVNTQGLKGDVRVLPTTDDQSRFDILTYADIEQNGVMARYNIEHIRHHKQFVILKLEGIGDVDTAEKLKGAVIKIEPSRALPLADDEYYIRDLYGMDVYTGDSEYLGKIEDVLQTGANDVYTVKDSENTILIPAVKQFILSVDVSAKKMIVRLPDGLR